MFRHIKGIVGLALLALAPLISLAEIGISQIPAATSRSSIVANTQVESLLIRSELTLEAELVNDLDAKRVKTGDEVMLRTTRANKQDGLVVIEKGARMLGRVVDVQAKTKTIDGSMIVFTIERIEQKSGVMRVSTKLVGLKIPKPKSPE